MEKNRLFKHGQGFRSLSQASEGIEFTGKNGQWIHRGHRFLFDDQERGTRKLIRVVRRTEPLVITSTFAPIYSFPKWSVEKTQLLEIASGLEMCFNDVTQRQITFSRLKNSLRQLKKNVGLENRGFLRVINMSYDALQNIGLRS